MERAGLYLHVPFCARICPYCDFAVLVARPEARTAFVADLLPEIDRQRGLELEFDTVYLGGGTPSQLEASQLGRLLEALHQGLRIAPDAWITLEANPEDVSPERLAAWRRLGVRTLSLGIQSLETETLALLGRRHSPAQARRAVALSLAAGFPIVSLDLIYGFDGHTTDMWARSLEQAVALGAHHISCYQLTIHEPTLFGRRLRRGSLRELSEDRQAQLLRHTHVRLAELGYAAYEVSSFARTPAHRSRHNQKYWSHAPYLGLGPSAHSFVNGERFWNEARWRRYRERLVAGLSPVAGRESPSPQELALEALMLGLRTTRGVDLAELRARFGVDISGGVNAGRISELAAAGLIEQRAERLVPTLAGLCVADGLAVQLAPG